jgi:thiopeptide-type bacteriocin biosynthesis protein
MLRAPLLPVERFLDIFAQPDRTEARLLALAREPVFREALWIASPTLARDLEVLERSGELAPKRRRSLLQGLARYAIRATTRPTPFGAFAGVGEARLQETGLRSFTQGRPEKRARLDYREVMKLVKELERDPEIRAHLTFFANPAAYRWGERMRLGYRDSYAQGERSAQLSLRVTEVVEKALAWTTTPLSYAELRARFQEAYPESRLEQIDAFLQTLIEQQLLLSTLRPPLTEVDPLAYLISKVVSSTVSRPSRASDHAKVARLQELQEAAVAYNDRPLGAGLGELRALYDKLGYSFGTRQTCLQVDLKLGALELAFPSDVQAELGRAAEALARLFAESPTGPLERYRSEFLEQYGEREVPLLELLDEEVGLGPPPGYRHPPPQRPWPAPAPSREKHELRHRYLARLVGEAARLGLKEIELNETELAESFSLPPLVASDLFVTTLASDVSALRRGDLTLLLSSLGGANSGATYGRFAYLEPAFHAHLQRLTEDEAAPHPDLVFADLTYVGQEGHVSNVAIHPSLYAHEIAVATTPGVPFEAHLPLNDLLVGVQAGRFYVRSRKLNCEVVVRAPHLLNKALAPNVVRFLQDIADANRLAVPAWEWGALQELPFLPRVRLGRVVLAPARWRLPEELATEREEARWHERLQRWREAWDLPRYVHAGSYDNRLLLDLEHPLCRELLHGLVRQEVRVLEEALWEKGLACATDAQGQTYVAELALPYRPAEPAPLPRATLAPLIGEVPVEQRRLLPGQGCLYFKLYGPPSHQNDVLEALAGLLQAEAVRWFFVRYRDPEAHLRFRILAPSPVLGELQPRFVAVLERLRARGFLTRVLLDTYERELERYGGPITMPLCETIFALDSAAVLALNAHLDKNSRPLDELALVSIDTLARGLGLPQDARHALYLQLDEGYAAEKKGEPDYAAKVKVQANEQRARVWELLREAKENGALARWQREVIGALRPHAEELTRQIAAGASRHPLTELAASLVHMHANRLGLDRYQEHRAIATLRRAYDGFCHFIPEGIEL